MVHTSAIHKPKIYQSKCKITGCKLYKINFTKTFVTNLWSDGYMGYNTACTYYIRNPVIHFNVIHTITIPFRAYKIPMLKMLASFKNQLKLP